MTSNIDQFQKQQYINVETYRKTGEVVRTPVWFAQEGSKLYVWTSGASGKAKRIRRNEQVKVAPCDQVGKLKGEFVPAVARVAAIDTPVFKQGQQLIDKKYGLLKKVFEMFNGGDKSQRVVIEITVQ